MRLGVLDVGSNTVHLLVVDAHEGARPLPAHSAQVRAAARRAPRPTTGSIDDAGADRLVECVRRGAWRSPRTAAPRTCSPSPPRRIREAPNGQDVLAAVRAETGVDLEVLTGEDEARLTFLAVRRWFGWSSGRLLVLDIGGGSLEMAAGIDEDPDAIALAAARRRPADPQRCCRATRRTNADVKALRKHVRRRWPASCGRSRRGASRTTWWRRRKTFKQLARLSGAPGSEESERVPRLLSLADLSEWVPRLAEMTYAERAELPGVSVGRAPQLLAGAVVAEAAMALLDVEEVQVCPWALREGVILRRLDWMSGAT